MATPFDYFRVEAGERLERLGAGLLALEKSPSDATLISDLFREAHSLKGAAGVSGLNDVADVCHKMEDVLGTLRDGAEGVSATLVDALLAATDAVAELVAAKVDGRDSEVVPGDVIERLAGLEASDAVAATVSQSAPQPLRADPQPEDSHAAPETVRLGVDLLETLGNRTAELVVAGERLVHCGEAVKALQKTVLATRARHLRDDRMQAILEPITVLIDQLADRLAAGIAEVGPLVTEIHEGVLETRMLPLGVLFDQLPRFVRDHCRQEGKEVELIVEGAGVRADRQVLEQLRDPVIHLIRNAVCHGIEDPDGRVCRGKPTCGTVRLATTRRGDRIRITCEDDGRGIDRVRVAATAIERGLLTEAEAAELSDAAIDRLILQPGFSTADMITDVSGRGVGMDVVLHRMEELHGTLDIESETGVSTTFVMEFPASLATLDGLLVETAEHGYVIPSASVERTLRVARDDIQAGGGGEALIDVEGQAVPLVALAGLLGRDVGRSAPVTPVVVVTERGSRLGLGVDRLIGTQTVVAKDLGDHIGGARGVAGATILDTGLPALILDTQQLVEGRPRLAPHLAFEDDAATDERAMRLLVVDDSITTRMMEQNILESAGYVVDTAVSAEDALSIVQNASYDLFVLDVEMPGLNGFQLTRKLRQDKRFADTPIVIVTSLADERDRREGLDAGANAYIVKGQFDQNNLLETVERLAGS